MNDKYLLKDETFQKLMRTAARMNMLPPRRDVQRPGPRGGVGPPSAALQVSSTTLQTVTLTNATIQAYPATGGYFDTATASWVDFPTAQWLFFLNGGKALTGIWYIGRRLGQDKNNAPIWGNPGFTCLGPVVVNVACSSGAPVQTIQYLNVPAGSYLSDNSTC